MTRLLLLMPLFVFLCAPIHAAPVDRQQAATVAGNWMLSHDGTYASYTVSESYPFSRGDIVTHYIFNMLPDGFVIVAGDDIAHPILMYGTTGHYDGTDLPPALAVMLEGYADDLLRDIADGIPAHGNVSALWEELRSEHASTGSFFKGGGNSMLSVSPLISTTWHQTSPYNLYCPQTSTGGSGGRVVTGCVATAMAMIMKYWGHPATGQSSHSYNHSTYGTLSADFGSTTYSWSSMPNSINNNSSSSAKNAIAQVMFHCGVSVEMNYAPNGSASSTSNARNAFVDYFRYRSAAQYRWRGYYTTSTWTALLVNELDNGRPVMYRGSQQNGSGGHAFIVDGYSGSDYFHMNFGWGGSLNGYFYLSSITPGSNTFTYYQGMITGLEPLAIDAPTLASPTHQSTDLCVTPTLSWNTVSVATSYRLQISTASSFTTTVVDNASLSTTSHTLTAALAPGTTYYWRVNAANSTSSSPWSAVRSFTTRTVTVTPAASTVLCEGDVLQLNGTTAAGVQYAWTKNGIAIPGATQSSLLVSEAGNYAMTIIDQGCATASSPVSVMVNPLPNASITMLGDENICEGQTSELIVDYVAGASYQWRKDGTLLPTATQAVYSVLESGTYDVIVTSAGCENTSSPVSVTVHPNDPGSFVWTGAVSDDWSAVGNWDSPCATPGSGDDVTIPAGVTPPNGIPTCTLGDLTIENSTGVVLSGALTIEGTLTLGNGHLSLGDNDVMIAASGDIVNAGASGHIITNGSGELWQLNIGSNGRSGAILYPLGSTPGSYTPLTLGNSATGSSFGLRILDEVLSEGNAGTPLTSGVVNRTWVLSSGGGQCDVSLVFGWSATEELQGFDRSQCYVTRHQYGSNWEALQQAGATTGSGTLTRIIGGLTSLTTAPTLLTIGSGSTLFPVEMLSFNALLNDGNVHLHWMTGNEVNNFGFRIQRRSHENADWQNAGFVSAATGGDVLHSYHWIDPVRPISHREYRLAQIDLDGSIQYSGVLSVAVSTEAGIRLGEVHPQPLLQGQSAGISLSAQTDTPLRLTLYDALGRTIRQVFEGVMQAGASRIIVLPTGELRPGSYFLRLESHGTSQIRKLSILR